PPDARPLLRSGGQREEWQASCGGEAAYLEVDGRPIERVRTLGGGRWTVLRETYLPSVNSWVTGNLRVAVGFAFTGAVVGEFVASSRDLGYLLAFAQSQFNAALTLALIVTIMTFVLILYAPTGALERRLLHWRYR
ncbi:MAG: ABC transporter permease subunit, partial [Trueperaceae bacterium]